MDQILEHNSDTLEFLKKQFDLDKPERQEEAIAILEEWLNKQQHLVRKSYSKDYLEKTIILSKGSVERAKMKLDKIATIRTLVPVFFEPIADVTKFRILDDFIIGFPSKMTKDHHRVFIMKCILKQGDASEMSEFNKYFIMLCEYLQGHDYSNGIIAFLDYREANLFELLKAINVTELQRMLKIITDGYGMRMKGIHFITSSKAIDALVTMFKQVLSAKVAGRIHVHRSIDDIISQYVPLEIMPKDYGGEAKTLLELSYDLKTTLSSETNMKYFKEMQSACTNETMRREDKFNEQYLGGTPGAFRKLHID